MNTAAKQKALIFMTYGSNCLCTSTACYSIPILSSIARTPCTGTCIGAQHQKVAVGRAVVSRTFASARIDHDQFHEGLVFIAIHGTTVATGPIGCRAGLRPARQGHVVER
jgi:hypothetical protein